MRIAVCGSCGRMGQLVIKVARELHHEIVAEIDKATPETEFFINNPDICIDFSCPAGTLNVCKMAARAGIPVVSGTTGLQETDMIKIQEYAKTLPILMSTNFSIGVYVLRSLVRKAISELPATFDIEIVEKHHNKKKDTPSGTALTILHDIQEVKKSVNGIFGRSGNSSRQTNDIGIHGVRGGSVVGEHTVYFFGTGETIEISHEATDREIFARGTIWAAEKFLPFTTPGIYDLSNILGR